MRNSALVAVIDDEWRQETLPDEVLDLGDTVALNQLNEFQWRDVAIDGPDRSGPGGYA
ncbi:hypothetical protein BJ085DRAFT_38161 [Dimargaris cristalligena]|uniref:Uncharacterized protein n=1 Tax=Dimargaris cristalligena TaxID=215637 RepID=A0A4P9ZSV1_9FUNG|nr:hypothetical protein BJ085DRAFT_38161 [Dimargaris cristalligena]|eukprot:RKP35570.1 hypothetical protein BJ085DRAFT_38161 [Dimargaris cristalligena]